MSELTNNQQFMLYLLDLAPGIAIGVVFGYILAKIEMYVKALLAKHDGKKKDFPKVSLQTVILISFMVVYLVVVLGDYFSPSYDVPLGLHTVINVIVAYYFVRRTK